MRGRRREASARARGGAALLAAALALLAVLATAPGCGNQSKETGPQARKLIEHPDTMRTQPAAPLAYDNEQVLGPGETETTSTAPPVGLATAPDETLQAPLPGRPAPAPAPAGQARPTGPPAANDTTGAGVYRGPGRETSPARGAR